MIKKTLALILVVSLGIGCVPDVATLKTAAFAVALVCLIAGTLASVIGIAEGWGVLPEVDFGRIVRRATCTPIASAVTLSGFMTFLGIVVHAIFAAH